MWQITILTDYNEVFSDEHLNMYKRYMEAAECTNVFCHPELICAWHESYIRIRSLIPYWVWGTDNNTGNVAIWPLVLWRRNMYGAFARVVMPMGSMDMDYHEPIFIYRPTTIMRNDFVDSVCYEINKRASADIILLDGMQCSKPSSVDYVDKIVCPYCDITGYDKDGIIEKLIGRRTVSEIYRRRRRLEYEGEVALHHYNKKDVVGCDESLKLMLECHTRRWSRAFKAPGFHIALVKRGVEAGIVDFSELRVGGRPVSWYIALTWRNVYSLYMPAWDAAYRSHGVGKLHLAMLVAEAAEQGMTRVDFMRGEEAYKMEWCDRKDYVSDFRIEGRSLRSRVVNTLLRLRR